MYIHTYICFEKTSQTLRSSTCSVSRRQFQNSPAISSTIFSRVWCDTVSFSNRLKTSRLCASKAKQRAYGIHALQYICFAEFAECAQGPTCAAALRELCVGGEGQRRATGTASQGPIVFALALLARAHGLRGQEDLLSL